MRVKKLSLLFLITLVVMMFCCYDTFASGCSGTNAIMTDSDSVNNVFDIIAESNPDITDTYDESIANTEASVPSTDETQNSQVIDETEATVSVETEPPATTQTEPPVVVQTEPPATTQPKPTVAEKTEPPTTVPAETKHEHVYKSSVVEASCDSGGYTYHVCKTCGDDYTDNYVSKLEHTWCDWVVMKNATTEKAGSKMRTCSVCGETEEKSIPKLTVPSGGTIKLNSSSEKSIACPKIEDFGAFFDNAMLLYDAIMANQDTELLLYFDEDDDYDVFESVFESKVFLNKFDLFCEKISTDDIDVEGMVICVHIIPSKIVCNDKVYYDANVSAGLYDGMSKRDAVVAINKWICNKLQFEFGVCNPHEAIKKGTAQCAAYAKLFSCMCTNAGITCEYIVGCAHSSDINTSTCKACHAWNRVSLDGSWYYVDTCWNDTGAKRNEWLLSDVLWDGRSINYTTRIG